MVEETEENKIMETSKCIYQETEKSLEIISECVINQDLKLLKEKYIEYYLKIKNVESSIIHYKNNCITTYTNNGEKNIFKQKKIF